MVNETDLKNKILESESVNADFNQQKVDSTINNIKKRRFFINDEEIKNLNVTMRDIVLRKKADEKLKLEGREFLLYKMCQCAILSQTQMFVLKDVGFLGAKCDVCKVSSTWMAQVEWKFYDHATKAEKKFCIKHVCKNCLDISGLQYINIAEWLVVVMANIGIAEYHGLHDGGSRSCMLCNFKATRMTDLVGPKGETTWVHIQYKNKLIPVAVCDRHFDAIIKVRDAKQWDTSIPEQMMAMAKQWLDSDLLNQDNYDLLNVYCKKDNKNGNKVPMDEVETLLKEE